jgi:hypothetical protein
VWIDSREPALQVGSPEFKPDPIKKKKKSVLRFYLAYFLSWAILKEKEREKEKKSVMGSIGYLIYQFSCLQW